MTPALKNAWSRARIDALAGFPFDGRKIDRSGQANAADVEHVGQAFQAHMASYHLGSIAFERSNSRSSR